MIGVPNVLTMLTIEQEKNDFDLSSLHGIVTMGSPLERAACIQYQKVLTPRIFNGYGTTESFWNTFLRPGDLPAMAGTAGSSWDHRRQWSWNRQRMRWYREQSDRRT